MTFDRIVTVDWSGASAPRTGRDSIWVCDLDTATGEAGLANPATRLAAEALLVELLARHGSASVLLAVDLALAYPHGFAAAAGLAGPAPAWESVWRHLASVVTDDASNANNRFEVAAELNRRVGGGPGPFWGCRPGAESAWLTARRVFRYPVAGLAEHRAAERAMLAAGHRIWSPWQLWGAGSVGSQALTGIPVLARLRWARGLDGRVRLWPCETGFVADPGEAGQVVVAECWPGVVPLDPSLHPVRDAAQVLGLAHHLAALQRDGALGAWFAPALDDATRALAVDEEAWVLGSAASPPDRSRPWHPVQ